jgi:hypothetical protein
MVNKKLDAEVKKLVKSMKDFRGNVQIMFDNCEKNNLTWLALAVRNLLNVIDEYMDGLNEFEKEK